MKKLLITAITIITATLFSLTLSVGENYYDCTNATFNSIDIFDTNKTAEALKQAEKSGGCQMIEAQKRITDKVILGVSN